MLIYKTKLKIEKETKPKCTGMDNTLLVHEKESLRAYLDNFKYESCEVYFITDSSHDFNNPILYIILACASSLKKNHINIQELFKMIKKYISDYNHDIIISRMTLDENIYEISYNDLLLSAPDFLDTLENRSDKLNSLKYIFDNNYINLNDIDKKCRRILKEYHNDEIFSYTYEELKEKYSSVVDMAENIYLKDEIQRISKYDNGLFNGYPCIYCLVNFSINSAVFMIIILLHHLYLHHRVLTANLTKLKDLYYIGNKFMTTNFSRLLSLLNFVLWENEIRSTNENDIVYAEEILNYFDMVRIQSISKISQLFINFNTETEFNNFFKNHFYNKMDNNDINLCPIIFKSENDDPNIIYEKIDQIINQSINNGKLSDKYFDRIHNRMVSYVKRMNPDNIKLIDDIGLNIKIANIINQISFENQYNDYFQINSDFRNKLKSNINDNITSTLSDLIGLNDAKSQIDSIIKTGQFANFLSYNNPRRNYRFSEYMISSMNMVFYGSPGTGKTTVARRYTKMLNEAKLRNNNVLIVGRNDLVGKYVGWTAKLIKENFEKAKGGVLFIDEAYALADDIDRGYGREAIDTIVECLDIYRSSTTVIFAGYADKMKDFIHTNPGLKSRISFYINFPDYSTDELVEIAKFMAKDLFNFRITKSALEEVKKICEVEKLKKNFGNARFVRNLMDKAFIKHACKYADKVKRISMKTLTTFTDDDFKDLNLKDVVYDPPKSGF